MTARSPRIRSSYTTGEVRALVEEREELWERVETWGFRLRILLCLADVSRVLPRLTLKQRQAVFLLGQLHLSSEEAARLLGIDEPAVRERYDHAILRLTQRLNGGT